MKHDYTSNSIILYIYKELDLFSKLEMEFDLEEDSTLLEEYQTLMKGFRILPKVTFSPKASTLQNILNYSARPMA